MILNKTVKGIIYVALGASSYGMLATFVKLAYTQGYTTAEVTSAQFLIAIICLLFISMFISTKKATKTEKLQLILSGTSMGFTSVLYYMCVKYVNASVAVVLLMQSVWIGVFIETVLTKKKPTLAKIVAVFLVLFGTLLATNVTSKTLQFNTLGFVFGFLSAISFAITLFSTNSIAIKLHPIQRSLYMLYGGAAIVITFALITQILPTYFNTHVINNQFITFKKIDFSILYTWGILLALFGTILPPILLNKGFPLTGVGLGSIVSALELPVSVTFAFFLLNEKVLFLQWIGILIILFAVLLINLNFIQKK
ncbi:DMT family transporter [Myroides sp. JBRI-B21084]|uniref:DMT family transporter n=1 Tax=Myroides sp. JBRI-B21084 TaxID=3119977 RepID=UPI003FA57A10